MTLIPNRWLLGVFGMCLLAACQQSPNPERQAATSAASMAATPAAARLQPLDAVRSLTCSFPERIYPEHCRKHWKTEQLVSIMSAGKSDCDDQANKTGCARKVEVRSDVHAPGGGQKPIPYCVAKFSYQTLRVPHPSGAGSGSTKVKWTLDDPENLKPSFATDSAPTGFGTGIALQGQASSPSTVWEPLSAETDSTKVVIKVKAGISTAQEFCHYPRVNVKDLGACCPGDPIIINDPS